MKIILFFILIALVWFNWNKVPEPIKHISNKAISISTEIFNKGKEMPKPVKIYVDSVYNTSKKKIKKIEF